MHANQAKSQNCHFSTFLTKISVAEKLWLTKGDFLPRYDTYMLKVLFEIMWEFTHYYPLKKCSISSFTDDDHFCWFVFCSYNFVFTIYFRNVVRIIYSTQHHRFLYENYYCIGRVATLPPLPYFCFWGKYLFLSR